MFSNPKTLFRTESYTKNTLSNKTPVTGTPQRGRFRLVKTVDQPSRGSLKSITTSDELRDVSQRVIVSSRSPSS